MNTSLHEISKQLFESRFVHYEPVLDALLTAYSEFELDSGVGANVVLFGKGGFGKSEEFCSIGSSVPWKMPQMWYSSSLMKSSLRKS